MKTPVIKILATGELINPNDCLIFTCGTLSHAELDRYGYPDNYVIYNSKEWEWSEEELDIFSTETYAESLHKQNLYEQIDNLMEKEGFHYKTPEEYDTRLIELEIEFGLRKQNEDG